MGPSGSATWNAVLDGAENLLREEGYAAMTSRRIAERTGIKQQLVYYYFETMDDLFTEMFRRMATREMERLKTALDSDRPVHEIWEVCTHTADSRLVSEFMALAHRSPGVRKQVIVYIEESRRLQIAAVSRAMKKMGSDAPDIPAAALAMFATSAALMLNREAELPITLGHAETIASIRKFLQRIDVASKSGERALTKATAKGQGVAPRKARSRLA